LKARTGSVKEYLLWAYSFEWSSLSIHEWISQSGLWNG